MSEPAFPPVMTGEAADLTPGPLIFRLCGYWPWFLIAKVYVPGLKLVLSRIQHTTRSSEPDPQVGVGPGGLNGAKAVSDDFRRRMGGLRPSLRVAQPVSTGEVLSR